MSHVKWSSGKAPASLTRFPLALETSNGPTGIFKRKPFFDAVIIKMVLFFSPSDQDIGGMPGHELAELIYNYQEPIMIQAAAAEEAERKDHYYQ